MPKSDDPTKRAAGTGQRSDPAPASGEAPEMAFDPIEAALRQLHDTVASEDIPDDFLRLLDQLDDRSSPE